MQCKSILVVEDDEDIRAILILALEAEGYRVHTAENGKRALDVLRELQEEELPTGILLDLMMPEMDGDAFLQVLHQEHADDWAKIPVIISTARGTLTNMDVISKTVAQIQKPMDLQQLYGVVKQHFGEAVQ